MRTRAEEGRDQDGRGGGLAMPHGHLQRARAAHHHVRQQRDRARREGKWEGAEVDGKKDDKVAAFLSFSIVMHTGSQENMPTHCLTVCPPTRVKEVLEVKGLRLRRG